MKESAEGIEKAFGYINTFALPPPGDKILRSSVKNGVSLSGELIE